MIILSKVNQTHKDIFLSCAESKLYLIYLSIYRYMP